MSRVVYVNGKFLAEEEAKISVFDRGFLFADGVYEVTTVLDGKLVDFKSHTIRLKRSLNEITMKAACSDEELLNIHQKLIKANDLEEGCIYLQVTRGVADRNFEYPDDKIPSTLIAFTKKQGIINQPLVERGAKIITVEDLRWGRRDIKTVQLLFPSMAKMEAKSKGADDAWLVNAGKVNEGTSNNAYIVTQDNVIVTRHLSNTILHGITRVAILKCARSLNLTVEERPFSIEEAQNAKEAFVSSSTLCICPVIEIDGQMIGDGKPGVIAQRLREVYIEEAKKSAT
ncbi:MAG: D-amino-acid transaminase [Cocleimonas sp.]|nr:D-amino-acid transaminase [Cocleimonas sp.]